MFREARRLGGSGRALKQQRNARAPLLCELLEGRELLAIANNAVLSMLSAPLASAIQLAQQEQSQSTVTRSSSATADPVATASTRGSHHLPKSASVRVGGTTYTVSVSGSGGVVLNSSRNSGVGILLLGTDQTTAVSVSIPRSTHASRSTDLPIGRIDVRTGALGAFQAATTAALNGPVTPLNGNVSALAFDAIGANATVDINGNLGGLTVTHEAMLGNGAHIHVSGDVTGPVSVGGTLSIAGGRLAFDRDVTGTMTVAGNLVLSATGHLSVGRDLNNLTVGGNILAGTGGSLAVGRNLGTLQVTGNIDTGAGGFLVIGGDLHSLSVNGYVHGKGSEDIVVGLNLGNIAVQGGVPGAGGIDHANLDVGKNIQGLDISHGIFNSRITAGVLLDGGSPTDAFNIGPDGAVAVFDSIITAGVQMKNLTISGDVVSDKPSNPLGTPTRIVAGQDKNGIISAGGNIDNFQITGRLVDAVIAASVSPSGGNGQFSPALVAPGTAADGYYDPPAGTVTGTFGPGTITLPNYTAPPYDTSAGVPIDDDVLSGQINLSFAPSLAASPPPLPTKSSVLGGVYTSPHIYPADYAGFFAADTRGVFVGQLPR